MNEPSVTGTVGPSAVRVDELEVSVFGPGTGECIVAHLGNNEWMVVDSCLGKGTKRSVALDYLEAINVPPSAVSVIAITHWHDDHTKGIAGVLRACPNAVFSFDSDLPQPEFIRESEHVARKQHTCTECCAPIHPGERYSLIVGKWDGNTTAFKACPVCVEIRTKMDAIGCTYSYGGLISDAHEALSDHDDADPASLERLAELLGVQREETEFVT